MNTIRTLQHQVAKEYPYIEKLYRHFHANPELSQSEKNTAARVARELKACGCRVTTGIGGHGVVGLLRNGPGPVILFRADMDALPVTEATGLPYASRVRIVDADGVATGVMHACGHDVHMAVMIGVARTMAGARSLWRGTLLCVGQPSEESMSGAAAMLADGFYRRFPRPRAAISLHVMPALPAGVIGLCPGFAWANADMLTVTVRGVGGHGAWPHQARDPVTLAAQLVLAFQSIVGREIDPVAPALISVGAIHGGTAFNIIPETVQIRLTVRTCTNDVRDRILAAIRRTATGLARASGMPADRLPIVTVHPSLTKAISNDPVLTGQLRAASCAILGARGVRAITPEMGGEDFGLFGQCRPRVPLAIARLGTSAPGRLAGRAPVPPLHSPLFAPVVKPTLLGGVKAMAASLVSLMPA